MPDESLIALTKAAAAQLKGKSILYLVEDPDGVPDDFRINLASVSHQFYKIAPSVASNNLTVAIQHLDGSSPSANNPMAFKVGDTFRVVTSSLSVTKNAGTNWCNAGSAELAGQPIDWFVYVLYETGASAGLKVLFSRLSHARTMADFVNTSTDEKYPAGNWTNFNSTDEVSLIGRFEAQLSAAASYNWSITTQVVINRPVYQSRLLTWAPLTQTPSVTGYSVNPGSALYRYQVLPEGMVRLMVAEGTNGTSNLGTKTYTAPFKLESTTNALAEGLIGVPVDNGVLGAAGFGAMITPGSNAISMFRSAAVAWTASGGCRIPRFNMVFKV